MIKARNNFEKNSINLLLPLPAKALNVTVRTKETKIPRIPRRFSTLCVFTGANIFSPLIQVFNWNVIWKKVPDYWIIWLIGIIYQHEEIIEQVLHLRSQLTKISYITQRNTRSQQGKTTYHRMSKAANESILTCVTSQHNKGPWVKPQKEYACLRKSLLAKWSFMEILHDFRISQKFTTLKQYGENTNNEILENGVTIFSFHIGDMLNFDFLTCT